MYVGNLPAWATDSDLVDVMCHYGPISKAWVIPGEGYGFVSFQDPGTGAQLLQSPPPRPPRLTDTELVLSSAFRAKQALQVGPLQLRGSADSCPVLLSDSALEASGPPPTCSPDLRPILHA